MKRQFLIVAVSLLLVLGLMSVTPSGACNKPDTKCKQMELRYTRMNRVDTLDYSYIDKPYCSKRITVFVLCDGQSIKVNNYDVIMIKIN